MEDKKVKRIEVFFDDGHTESYEGNLFVVAQADEIGAVVKLTGELQEQVIFLFQVKMILDVIAEDYLKSAILARQNEQRKN